jgi:lipopolysaccharide/colanic/teichoic acid biosynthesis glycosyltransferase
MLKYATSGPEEVERVAFERQALELGAEAGAPIYVEGIENIATLLGRSWREGRPVAIASRDLEPVAERLGIRERTPEGHPVLRFEWRPRTWLDSAALRLLECLLAVVVLLGGAPLWLLIGLLIWLESPGGALHVAPRAGRGGRPFSCLKYRTMRVGDDNHTHEAARLAVIRGDILGFVRHDGTVIPKHPRHPRTTRVGRILRWLSVDEVPQFLHILTGQMALVGPRPYPMPEFEALKPWHRLRVAGRPGITGLWQVAARNQVTFDESVIIDIYYLANATLWLDLRIIFVTPVRMLFGVGSY